MYQSRYFIEKSSQTFADSLAAFGLGSVLNRIADGRAQIRLEDAGSAFIVVCEPELQEEWFNRAEFFPGAPFLVTVDNKTRTKMVKGTDLALSDLPIGGSVVVDYEAEKERNSQFFEWRKGLSNDERREFARGNLRSPISPHPDWDLFRAVNPASLQAYNGLAHEWWRAKDLFPEMLKILLQMTAQMPNDVLVAEKAWEALCKRQKWSVTKKVSASQLFNPSQGKGTNAAKSVWVSPSNLDNFWMLEWLKVEGIRQGGFTKQIRGTKDRKTYALIPVRLEWGSTHVKVMEKFRQKMAGSANAIQMDALASLRYTQALIDHVEAARDEDLVAQFLGHPANNFVQGLQMAFYKDMGNSIATMNISSIGLPRWVKPQTSQDFQGLREALAEHELIVRTLDESRSDQYDLLKQYRDFLSANDLTPFFRFAVAYSSFIVRQMERRQFVRPFTTSTLEVLFMNSEKTDYGQIIRSKGFKDIAYAIRRATITAQYRKANRDRYQVRYDVRYGLGQQLARKANYPSDFLTELTKFLQEYNAETSQEYENLMTRYKGNIPDAVRRQMRRAIEETALDDIVQLLGKFNNNSKLICHMLVAYGYAREPFEKDKDSDADMFATDTANAENGSGTEEQ